jgi:hypothetical protein
MVFNVTFNNISDISLYWNEVLVEVLYLSHLNRIETAYDRNKKDAVL